MRSTPIAYLGSAATIFRASRATSANATTARSASSARSTPMGAAATSRCATMDPSASWCLSATVPASTPWSSGYPVARALNRSPQATSPSASTSLCTPTMARPHPADVPEQSTCGCVVIGGGAAGLTCAIFLGRYDRPVVLLDNGKPRNYSSRGIHGFLGEHVIPPGELLKRGRKEAESAGVEIR